MPLKTLIFGGMCLAEHSQATVSPIDTSTLLESRSLIFRQLESYLFVVFPLKNVRGSSQPRMPD
jgi:hypothetical protein